MLSSLLPALLEQGISHAQEEVSTRPTVCADVTSVLTNANFPGVVTNLPGEVTNLPRVEANLSIEVPCLPEEVTNLLR